MSYLYLIAAALASSCAAYLALATARSDASASSAHSHFYPARSIATLQRLLAPVLQPRAQNVLRARCLRQAPEMFDVLTLGLSAGLSFDSSLALYCDNVSCELSELMRTSMLRWQIGVTSREQALQDLAKKLNVTVLHSFAASVSEALAFGSPLAETLEQQAQLLRDEQQAQVEEQIEKIPVKMLIPLGTLIVPAMLLAVLGPLLGAALSAPS